MNASEKLKNVASSASLRPTREAVKRQLLNEIGRSYRPGDRVPSVRQLAEQLQVAHGTAYLAVRELTEEGVLELRPRLGAYVSSELSVTQLRSKAEMANRQQGGGNSPLATALQVAVVFKLSDHFLVEIYEGFHQQAQKLGIEVQPVIISSKQSAKAPLAEASLPRDADGVVYINPTPWQPIHVLPGQAVGLITNASEQPEVSAANYDVVSIDQSLGGRIAGRALRDAGCRSLFFVGVGGTDGSGGARQAQRLRLTCFRRLEGVELGFGAGVADEHISIQHSYSHQDGGRAAEVYAKLDSRPDGVFCATDELAVGFQVRAAELGLKAGQDYLLVGFDGQSQGETLPEGPIATVRIPAEEMGRRAADLMLERVARPDQSNQSLLLGCELRHGFTLGSFDASPQDASMHMRQTI